MWTKTLKETESLDIKDFKLNKESNGELKKIQDTDSIVSINRLFRRELDINNFIVVDESNASLGLLPRRMFTEIITNKVIPFKKYINEIKEFSAQFDIVEKGNKTHNCIINYNITLKETIRFFFTKQISIYSPDKEFYPEAAIILDDSDKLYSIISYKDVLKLINSDEVLKAKFKIDSKFKEKGKDVSIIMKYDDINFLSLKRDDSYKQAFALFMAGFRTIPIMENDKFIGLMVNYISAPEDYNQPIEDQYIYFSDSFKNVSINKKNDKIDDIISKFRTRPYFSSLPIVKGDDELEGIISYTNILKWAYENIQ